MTAGPFVVGRRHVFAAPSRTQARVPARTTLAKLGVDGEPGDRSTRAGTTPCSVGDAAGARERDGAAGRPDSLSSVSMLHRHRHNPILTRDDIPDLPAMGIVDATSVFNPGAVRREDGRDLLMLRVQTRGRRSVLMLADEEARGSSAFIVRPEVVAIDGLADVGETLHHVYDPRLTILDGKLYVVLACDTPNGCRLATARGELDGTGLHLVAFDRAGDRRNGVLFPERVGGRYLRLERPNRVSREGAPTSGAGIVLAESDDLVNWTEVGPVMDGQPHFWDELIGSGPPPVRVAEGWLHIYHGVATHFAAANIYQAGAVLLDAGDPTRVLARTRDNILEPREMWEMVGQVPNVVFPSGMTVDGSFADGVAPPTAALRVYYGAADTVIGLAETSVASLIDSLGS